MSSEDKMIRMVVNEAWDQYDTEQQGRLDKEKTKRFLADKLQEFGVDGMSDEAFDATFAQYDLSGIGTIAKGDFVELLGKCAAGGENNP